MSDILLLVLSAARAGNPLSVAPQVYAIVGEGGGGTGSGSSGSERPDLLVRIAGAFRAAEKWLTISEAAAEARTRMHKKLGTFGESYWEDKTLHDSLCKDATNEADVFADYVYDNFRIVTDDDYDRLVGECQALLKNAREPAPVEKIAEVTEMLIPVALLVELIRFRRVIVMFSKKDKGKDSFYQLIAAYKDVVFGVRSYRRRLV